LPGGARALAGDPREAGAVDPLADPEQLRIDRRPRIARHVLRHCTQRPRTEEIMASAEQLLARAAPAACPTFMAELAQIWAQQERPGRRSCAWPGGTAGCRATGRVFGWNGRLRYNIAQPI